MDFGDGLAIGYALARNNKGGGGSGKDIFSVLFSVENLVVRTISDRISETPNISEYIYLFGIKDFSSVTVAKRGTSQITRTWTKRIITSVSYGEKVIWTLKPDSSGVVIAVYDANGNDVLNGITNGLSVLTGTPDGIALGCALAYNKSQDGLVEKLVETYKQGIDDGEELDVDPDTPVDPDNPDNPDPVDPDNPDPDNPDNPVDPIEFEIIDFEGSGAYWRHFYPTAFGDEKHEVYCDYIIYHKSEDMYPLDLMGLRKSVTTYPSGEVKVTVQDEDTFYVSLGQPVDNSVFYGDIRYVDK